MDEVFFPEVRIIRQKVSSAVIDAVVMVVGTFIAAMALDIFLVPYKIAPGGASGIGMIAYHLSGGRISVGLVMILINVPLLFIGYRKLGIIYALKSILGTLLYSLFIDFLMPLAAYLSEVAFKIDVKDAPDLLLYSIFGGIILGIGLGLVIRSGSSTGGSDIGAQLLNYKFSYITTGAFLLVLDAIIVILVAIFFGNFLYALYSTIAIIISAKLIDVVVEGLNQAKAVYIISSKSDEIAEKIIVDLQRGVTALTGTGVYTKTEKNVLLCIINNRQIVTLKRLITSIDDHAFVILADVREVVGEGFNVKK